MNTQTRNDLLESYRSAGDILASALQRYPRGMWQFRPSPDSWTIHEIIVHIADSEVNSYVRCRRLLAEPGSQVLGYDEMRWAHALDYHAQNPEDALELFVLLRKLSYRLIHSQPDSAAIWSNTIHHSENGRMTMDDWLETYARHIPDHVAQMDEVYQAWLSSPNR